MCYKELFVLCVDFASVSQHCQDLNSPISILTLILWKILCLGCLQYSVWLQVFSLNIEIPKIMNLSIFSFLKFGIKYQNCRRSCRFIKVQSLFVVLYRHFVCSNRVVTNVTHFIMLGICTRHICLLLYTSNIQGVS